MRTTTTRGVLWEVIAPVVRWPMYSPLRFGLVVVAVLAVLLVVGELTEDAGSAPESAAGQSEAPAPKGDGGSAPDGAAAPQGEPALESPSAGTHRTVAGLARRFVTAYLDAGVPQRRWQSRLKGMATRELGRALGTVDRANVADLGARVTRVDVRGVAATAASALVVTDRAEFTVDMSHSGRDWVVTRVLPARPGAGEAA